MSTQLKSHAEVDFLGTRARIVADGAETGGSFGIVDMLEVPAGHMPPLHVHRSQDEGFYVLEGELSLFMPEQRIDLGPGDFTLAPRGIPHSYRVGDSAARLITTSTPAGFEQFVAAVAELDDVDPGTLTEVAARHDIEILGPPGMLP
jgi:quercetin dioxygenase-like cupin family protein